MAFNLYALDTKGREHLVAVYPTRMQAESAAHDTFRCWLGGDDGPRKDLLTENSIKLYRIREVL
jgi:hypothetical protein